MSNAPEKAETAPALDESLVGQVVGKYEIVRVVGRGGMGMVYEALNTAIGKRVAMKFVDPESAKNTEAVARFQREAQAASAVESAHIVEIFDSGVTDDGLPFIVMELLRGEDLGHRIQRCGRLEVPDALYVIAQILRGLHRAHEAGIVHRDLKPDNVFLVDRDDDSSFAKILDFGISKMQRRGEAPATTLTRQGTVLGTPFYMSPEQAQALADIDGRTDLWSVGAILFECLTGRAPHTGGSYEQVIINICMKDVDDVRVHNPSVPEPLAKVIAKALTRERESRFGSARDFLDALVGASGGVLSSRSGRMSDEATSRPGSTPSGRTPVSANSERELAPTVEVASGGPSKVGWSTSSRSAGPRDKRIYAMVGGGSLCVGALVAVFMFRARSNQEHAAESVQSGAPMEPAIAEVQLSSNTKGARFWVDGALVANGVLRGPKGEKRKVKAEADGYAAVEADVTLEAGSGPVVIALTEAAPPPPTVDPAGPAGEPTTTPASTKGPGRATPGKSAPKAAATPAGKPEEPPQQPPPKPKATGVAPGLSIKSE